MCVRAFGQTSSDVRSSNAAMQTTMYSGMSQQLCEYGREQQRTCVRRRASSPSAWMRTSDCICFDGCQQLCMRRSSSGGVHGIW